MECSEGYSETDFFSSLTSSVKVEQTSVKKRQQAEIELVKVQCTSPLKTVLLNTPFNYDQEIVDEICIDLLDGMELHLNAGKGDVHKDIDWINELGQDLASLKENVVLYCVLDPGALNVEESDLKISNDLPLSLFITCNNSESWPGEGNFVLSKVIKVASYIDLSTAIAYFMDKVSTPRGEWAGMVADIVVVGSKQGVGLELDGCPAGVLDIPLVFDITDGFKKRMASKRRGPYAVRVALSNNEDGKGHNVEFGFKQYIDADNDYRVYNQPNSALTHPDAAEYKHPEGKNVNHKL